MSLPNPTLTILTIDDKMLTSELDKAGYRKIGITIRSAANFQEADSLLHAGGIDAVIVNDDYKEINGLAILQHFKKQAHSLHLPFVFTSVRSKPKNYRELCQAGLDLFVEQPVPRHYFVEKIRSLLDQKMRDDNRMGFKGRLEFVYGDEKRQSDMQDMSKTGLLLLSEQPLDINCTIQMSFLLPAYKKPIKVDGTIVRAMSKIDGAVASGYAYGVRFDKFLGDSQKRLESYISKNNMDDPRLVYYL